MKMVDSFGKKFVFAVNLSLTKSKFQAEILLQNLSDMISSVDCRIMCLSRWLYEKL